MPIVKNAMCSNVLDIWETIAVSNDQSLIIPDGCCDLIFKFREGQAPVWFLSDLSDTSQIVPVFKGDYFTGYRLRPGTRVQAAQLLKSVRGHLPGGKVLDLIDHYTTHHLRTEDALKCLASGVVTVNHAASDLGVSPRTLQRFIVNETGKSPVFWHRLARVRRAGRDIINAGSLAEFAFDYGFSDQAHMTREFRQWFDLSPRTFAKISQQQDVFQTGYG